MTKDNASGAGMETVARIRSVAAGADGVRIKWCGPFAAIGEELVRRTDATRLLAESQEHNAKLEAQVEQMRALLTEYLDIRDEAASIDDVLPDQSIKAWTALAERQTALEILARAAIKTRGQNDSPSPAASMEVQGLTRLEVIRLWANRSDGPDNAEIVSYAEDLTCALAAKNGWRLGKGRG